MSKGGAFIGREQLVLPDRQSLAAVEYSVDLVMIEPRLVRAHGTEVLLRLLIEELSIVITAETGMSTPVNGSKLLEGWEYVRLTHSGFPSKSC